MKVKSVSNITSNITKLRNDMIISSMLGDYKGFKTARKAYASVAVKNFDTVRKTPSPKVTVPLFSKQGLRMLKVLILDTFRKKTPDEKLFNKMAKAAKKTMERNEIINKYLSH